MSSAISNRDLPVGGTIRSSEFSWGVAQFVTAFASAEAATGDLIIASLVSQAVDHNCLAEATFWQRVKFQARVARVIPNWGKNDHTSGEAL